MAGLERILRTETIILRQDEGQVYLERLAKFLKLALGESDFPNIDGILNLINLYKQGIYYGIYEDLEIDKESGFLTSKAFREVRTSKELVQNLLNNTRNLDQIKKVAKEKLFGFDEEKAKRLEEAGLPLEDYLAEERYSLGRLNYFTQLQKAELPEKFHVKTSVEGVENKRLFLNFLLEGFDLTKNLFVKYSIISELKRSFFSRFMVELEEEPVLKGKLWQPLFEQLFGAPPKAVYDVLREIRIFRPLKVVRAAIGPIYFSGTKKYQGAILDKNQEQMQKSVNETQNSFVVALPKSEVTMDYSKKKAEFREHCEDLYLCSKNIFEKLRYGIKEPLRMVE